MGAHSLGVLAPSPEKPTGFSLCCPGREPLASLGSRAKARNPGLPPAAKTSSTLAGLWVPDSSAWQDHGLPGLGPDSELRRPLPTEGLAGKGVWLGRKEKWNWGCMGEKEKGDNPFLEQGH